jgi:hypothetical protein
MTEKLKAITLEFERKKRITFAVAGVVYLIFISLFLLFITSCSFSGSDPGRPTGKWAVDKFTETGFPLN